MITTPDRSKKRCRILLIGWTLIFSVLPGLVVGQSKVVFMTTDISPDFQSKLFRFDAGVETFGIAAGPSNASAFHGITVLNGKILVADFISNKILQYSPSGTQLTSFAAVTDPTFLESDSAGNVYTTPFSLGPALATRFNSAGVQTQTFSGSGEFAGIDADAAGNVYIIESFGADQLLKYAPNGTFLNSISLGTNSAADLAINEAGQRLYVATGSGGANGIKVYDISGAMPSFVGSIATPATSIPYGIHFAAQSGNILTVDSGQLSNDTRGIEYSSSGVLLREYRPTSASVARDITTFVPEPSLLVTLLVAMLCLAMQRRTVSGRTPG